MVNKSFKDTFNFFVDTINSINDISNKKHHLPLDVNKNSLKRICDSIEFIHKKKHTFESDLTSLRNELIEIRKDADKLTIFFATNPASFRSVSLIDNLILELDFEIKERSKRHAQTAVDDPNTPKSEKVKIFQSAFAKTVEDQMNDFLSKNNVSIIRTMQNTDGGNICITIFYTEK